MIRIKRTYDTPARGDGLRILVERLWPRGMKKENLDADVWLKEVAPSTKLRKWFDHRVERWPEFRRQYRKELAANQVGWEPIVEAEKHGNVTLLYSAHDVLHNGAVVLRDYLSEKTGRKTVTDRYQDSIRRRKPNCERHSSPSRGRHRAGRVPAAG